MKPIETYHYLAKLSFEYDKDDTKELRFNITAETMKFLDQWPGSEEKHGKICVGKKLLPFAFYEDVDEFLAQAKEEDIKKPVVIQNFVEGKVLTHDTTALLGGTEITNYLISNARTYYESKNFFRELHDASTLEFDFVDFYSTNSLIMASVKDKKRLKFDFRPTGCIKLDPSINYSEKFSEFKSRMGRGDKQYPLFLKNSMISILTAEDGDKYTLFFDRIPKILNDANLNFNVYLHELSLDKIKADYKEYKQKYFASQNEILGKVTNQVIALPISISAAVFALFRLDGSEIPIIIVCFGILTYIIYVSFVARIYASDLVLIDDQLKHDYNTLSGEPFFIDNKPELSYFDGIKESLVQRVRKLYSGLKAFVIIMWIASVALLCYGTILILPELNQMILLFGFILACSILGLIFDQLVFNEKFKDKGDSQ